MTLLEKLDALAAELAALRSDVADIRRHFGVRAIGEEAPPVAQLPEAPDYPALPTRIGKRRRRRARPDRKAA